MIIGVIIPTFNRLSNLMLVMESLNRQLDSRFTVVVADDGSTDGTREFVEGLAQVKYWEGRLRWIGCGMNHGFRAARTRNIAAGNLPADCDFMVMLDSDSILEEHAIESYRRVHERHPNAVIMGITEWLPPLSAENIRQIMKTMGVEQLRQQVPKGRPERVQGTFVGTDLRHELELDLFSEDLDRLRLLMPEWALPLNSGYPLKLFWDLGGFDEMMVGYGYEDIELGVRANKKDVQCILYSEIRSLHIWHAKDTPEQRLLENQINLDYVLRKHGPNEVLENEVDWTLGLHYHKQRGGRLLYANGALWATNRWLTQRVRIINLEWVERLGFLSIKDIEQGSEQDLEQANYVGNI